MVQTQFSFTTEAQRNYLDEVRAILKARLRKGQVYVTSDDAWRYCPPPKYVNTKIMGAIFTDRDFQSIGFTRSQRPTSHGRAIQKFRLRQDEEQ